MSTAKHTPTLLPKEEIYQAKELCVSMGECSATYYIVMLTQEVEWRRQLHDDLLEALKDVLSLAKEWGKNPEYYTQAEANIIGFAEDAIAKAEGGAL